MECKKCHEPMEAKQRRRYCKGCARNKLSIYRSKMSATTKSYYNLKQRLRENKRSEGALWSRKDVEELVKQLQIPADIKNAATEMNRSIRFKVVQVDESKAFLPNNSRVEIIGA